MIEVDSSEDPIILNVIKLAQGKLINLKQYIASNY